jgi:hypothetical protein
MRLHCRFRMSVRPSDPTTRAGRKLRAWSPIGVIFVSVVGCAKSEATRTGAAVAPPSAHSAPASAPASSPPATACLVTQTIEAPAPENTEGGPADSQRVRWYTNADHTIWMFADRLLVPGKASKVAWFRPPGAQLEVSGRRLDAAAPPLAVDIPVGSAYVHRFTPSGMTFPTGGCWKIVAKADQSELSFIIEVPSSQQTSTGD